MQVWDMVKAKQIVTFISTKRQDQSVWEWKGGIFKFSNNNFSF
jgi:hypothetical protein